MASLSLPRVLQLKKNSLDAEREQFEKFQTQAIQKAINSVETPVKEKHVRSTIIGTFQEQSAITYWMVALRLPLQDNRIAAWKFCHVTHKLLREGHPACLDDSQRHITMIENLGKLWVHLREGYGRLIHLYSNLLVCKLKFHARNPRFPGNLQLTSDELDAIAENDVNNYFQLCVELFDYMDDLLNLQAAVFDSLGNARANSMTASGQCRLAALIPCAQDSSQIYDCNVRLLFRLHAALPAETLAGHRERFRQQFRKLSSFYRHASSLQYYRNLLTLPVLPSNPPNFLQQSDFGTYVAPVVSIPEHPPDDIDTVGSLIDTSDTISMATTPDNFDVMDSRATPSPPQPDPVVERDRLIDHLQHEIRKMRTESSQMVQERNTILSSMRDHCTRIETQLARAKSELEEERQKSDLLLVQTPEIKQKLTETEEKAKVTDEKFQKLKGAYTQLREEHINLIRQKAEVDKTAAGLRSTAAQHESAKMALQQQLNDRVKDVELLQQSASSSEEVEAYKNEILSLREDLEQSRQKEIELETLRASMETLRIEHETTSTEQQEKIITITSGLKEVTDSLEKVIQEKEERETELSRVKEELVGLREQSGNDYKKVVEEKEVALRQVAELTQQFQQEKEEQIQCNNNLQTELESLQRKLNETEMNFTLRCEKLNEEMSTKNQEAENALTNKDTEIKETVNKLTALQKEIEITKRSYEENMQDKHSEITSLQDKINKLVETGALNLSTITKIESEKDRITIQFNEITEEKAAVEKLLSEKEAEVSSCEKKIQELIDIESSQNAALLLVQNNKNLEIDQLKSIIVEKDNEIGKLQIHVHEITEDGFNQKSAAENLSKALSEFEIKMDEKDNTIRELNSKLVEASEAFEKHKVEFAAQENEKELQITMLNDKLQTVTDCKNELIQDLKKAISEKDGQVIGLNIEVNNLSVDVTRLNDELKEAQAELEIGKNEFLALREEHENIVQRNEHNLVIKNQELRSLNDDVSKLSQENTELVSEKNKLCDEFTVEKQVLENKIKELEDVCKKTMTDYEAIHAEKEEIVSTMTNAISEVKTEYEQLKDTSVNEIYLLNCKIKDQVTDFNDQVCRKDEIIAEAEKNAEVLKVQLEDLQKSKEKEKNDMDDVVARKDQEMQMLEARLQHTEGERLTMECELQDLLQNNTVLEADLAAVKRQLDEAREELVKQRSTIADCAGDAALAVTDEALAALERANAQDSNRTAALLAAQALDQLAKHPEVKGNEAAIAQSAIAAAHNTAALCAYVTEVCNVSTDMELSDKLNNECRAMLTATKQCLESIKTGLVQTVSCVEARQVVTSVAKAAAAADRSNSGTRSVDDELADMDTAIEQAASQIESLLAASRAGDSGVKLEVNGKILDACTTLMGAVKLLVQDARKLQNELGDPKTRQKMYRRNPQWSEGLISAAKAVVFAAKLLVSSADEAVGAAGRVEGVSAAAHEVAGSTAQLVAASRARAPPASPALQRLTHASRSVAAATGAVVAAVRAGAALVHDQDALDTSALTLTATRRLEMESKVRSLELESALDAERAKLAALRKRHYQLAQLEENGSMTNGK